MKDIAITLLLTVTVTLAIGVIVFPVAAWLFPFEGRSEDDLSKVLRNSITLFITLAASFAVQKLIIKKFFTWMDNKS